MQALAPGISTGSGGAARGRGDPSRVTTTAADGGRPRPPDQGYREAPKSGDSRRIAWELITYSCNLNTTYEKTQMAGQGERNLKILSEASRLREASLVKIVAMVQLRQSCKAIPPNAYVLRRSKATCLRIKISSFTLLFRTPT